jgi:hypothetical protein
MFVDANEPLALLVTLSRKGSKKLFRQAIYEHWNHECGYCGQQATSLDHIVPRFRSGPTNRHNLLPACQRCNSLKGSHPVREWYEKQPFFCQDRMKKIEQWMEQEVIQAECEIPYLQPKAA